MNIDLQDPELFREGAPYDVYKHLRETDPVHWQDEADGPGYWALTRYEDIKRVELDSETFSNEPTVLISDVGIAGDETHKHLIFSDAPHHTEHRQLLSKEIGLSRIRKAREGMETLVDSIIDVVIEKGEADLVVDLSSKMASFAIADLMGLDRAESLEMFHAAEILTRNVPVTEGIGLEAITTMFTHASQAWAQRSADPRDDTLSRIAHAEIMGNPVDEFQFQLDYQLLVSAGSDTSRNVLSTGMITLFEHPEARQALLDDPTLLPKALEEILRYTPPIMAMRRTTTADTEIGGTKIGKGQKVVMYYGAANRDPEVFDDPDTFEIRRKVNPHMTFGGGRHHCLGAHLARLELTTMFSAMLRRMPDMAPIGPVDWPELGTPPMVGGPAGLRVGFTPGTRIVEDSVAPIFA
ncbi:cytochrome P450 (plasmid) [Mycolicibacterium madagascariense]|uniref:Steroid C26-monooxygenase n=1 Tax=Mycolicibacterium madagascariense TaxID=212765 RepID=A0A7I7XPX6_9MYCO|nr:cytochrome P450 [Mycolicibacterium madagascariense]BBZ31245.1 cytochrome P450 [Mycolicibacterium madagascariense]